MKTIPQTKVRQCFMSVYCVKGNECLSTSGLAINSSVFVPLHLINPNCGMQFIQTFRPVCTLKSPISGMRCHHAEHDIIGLITEIPIVDEQKLIVEPSAPPPPHNCIVALKFDFRCLEMMHGAVWTVINAIIFHARAFVILTDEAGLQRNWFSV